jgi:hypothetical protein
MSAAERVEHAFVEFIPDELVPNTVYVSMEYGTAVHACLCGCGHRVITPFTPNDWQLTYDGDTISLHPSIGSWSFPCQSHYIINESRVIWAEQWSQERIDAGRSWDKRRKDRHYSGRDALDGSAATPTSPEYAPAEEIHPGRSAWSLVRAIARRLRRLT